MSTINIDEVYYLVRIGSWSEADLERWVQKRISDQVDEVTADFYEKMLYEKTKDHENAYRWADVKGRW